MIRFSLCTIVKNEIKALDWWFEHLEFLTKYGLAEVNLTDTGSTDGTKNRILEWKEMFPVPVNLYQTVLHNFGQARNFAISKASKDIPLFFVLDIDERVLESECGELQNMLSATDISIWRVPRKKYTDLEMNNQIELDKYPDWQWRFGRNDGKVKYRGLVHEGLTGGKSRNFPGPFHIHHFQPCWRTHKERHERQQLYTRLMQEQNRKQ